MGSNLGGHKTGAKAVRSEKTRPVLGMKLGSLLGSSLASAFASFGVEGVVGGACSFSIASGAGSNACAVLGSNGMLLGPQKLWPAREAADPHASAASRAPGPPVLGGLSEH